ncbi:MAG TPA: ATP-binding protein, partial [Catenuloplanes sp.]
MPPAVHCDVRYHDRRALVRMTGSLSLATAPTARIALLKCIADQPDAVIVDLAELVVEEPLALSVFTAVARQAAMWPGTPILFSAPPAPTAALLTSGGYGPLPIYPSVRAALATSDGRVSLPSLSDELLPVSGACRQARDLLTEACVRWDLPHLVAPASIVAGELVANVIAHAHTPMTLRLALRRRHLHIAVRDGCNTEPKPAADAPPLTAAAGRGLLLVGAIAQRWGSLPTHGGKVVWAILSTSMAPMGPLGTPL